MNQLLSLPYTCLLLLVFLLATSVDGISQVEIKGQTSGFIGTIEAKGFTDYLSMEEISLQESQTDDSGNFSLNLDSIDRFQRIEIQYGRNSKWLYVGPSGTYEVLLDSSNGRIQVSQEPADQTNMLIQQFSESYRAYRNSCKRDGKTDLKLYTAGLENFANELESEYSGQGNAFFKSLIQYYIMERRIEFWIRHLPAKKADKKAIQAIEALPIDIHNPGFWSMLGYYHNNRLHQYIGSAQRRFSALLSVADLYQVEALRDLSLLLAYRDALSRRLLEKDFLLEKLRTLENGFEEVESKQLANRLIKRYDRFNEGDYFPDFELAGINGDTVRLTDFLGKPIYIDLFGVWCGPCRASMKRMPPMVEQFGADIHFLSISFHDSEDQVIDFVSENQYDWHFAIAGFDSQLESQLNQSVYPTYVLLDSKGRILDLPAKKPNDVQICDYLQLYIDQESDR